MKRRTIGISIFVAVAILCAFWFIHVYGLHQAAPVSTAPGTGSAAAVKTKRPGVPEWADNASSWTFDTGLGRVGFSSLTGGQIHHGGFYQLHLGPLGACSLQGPEFKFLRGPHTRKTVTVLALGVIVVSLVAAGGILRRKRTES